METLSRERLTAALAARQLLLERPRIDPAEAIRRLTPLQAQHPPAPFIALAARLDGFTRAGLEAEIGARRVVKSTLLRLTLHLTHAHDYPAYAQLSRQFWLRKWRATYPHLDEEEVAAELGAWLREPRTNGEIREYVRARYDGVPDFPYAPLIFARTVLPLVQLPPAGFYADTRRKTAFVADPRPRPELVDAAALVIGRYLAAFGPAQKRDVSAWLGAAQADFTGAWERIETVSYRDEQGRRLFDLPEHPLPPADTPLPSATARPLGPGAARVSGPRTHHPPRAQAAPAHAQRLADRYRRRTRRRKLGLPARGRARAGDDRAAHGDLALGAGGDRRGGGAHRAHPRARRRAVRSRALVRDPGVLVAQQLPHVLGQLAPDHVGERDVLEHRPQ